MLLILGTSFENFLYFLFLVCFICLMNLMSFFFYSRKGSFSLEEKDPQHRSFVVSVCCPKVTMHRKTAVFKASSKDLATSLTSAFKPVFIVTVLEYRVSYLSNND